MSLSLSTDTDMSADADERYYEYSSHSQRRKTPFRKYRRHFRSRTDPDKMAALSRESPRYHSDPAAADYSSSPSTPRSPPRHVPKRQPSEVQMPHSKLRRDNLLDRPASADLPHRSSLSMRSNRGQELSYFS